MKYRERFENQDKITAKGMKLTYSQFGKIPFSISNAKNTQYDDLDILRTVLEMSQGRNFARSATLALEKQAYRKEKQNGKGKKDGEEMKVPSPDWTLGKLGEVDPEEMDKWCNRTIEFMSKKALNANMISKTTTVGIDLTLIPYYGKELRDKMLKTLSKNGTSHFDAYMTTHSIGPGYEIPLSNTRMTRDDNVDVILYENIKKIERAGVHPSLYLLDRGYFSIACLLILIRYGRDYIMPIPKNARIKEKILQYHNGKIPADIMENKEFGSVSFNLLIVKKDNFKESDPVEDQYVAFATNMPCRTKEELVETIPETYRERWIIETAFRVIKDVKGKTCSNKLHVRIFLFCFALLLYCLWKCVKYVDMLQDFLAGGADFTIAEFLESMGYTSQNTIEWETHHGNFFEN